MYPWMDAERHPLEVLAGLGMEQMSCRLAQKKKSPPCLCGKYRGDAFPRSPGRAMKEDLQEEVGLFAELGSVLELFSDRTDFSGTAR
jgi:hypothetical protein